MPSCAIMGIFFLYQNAKRMLPLKQPDDDDDDDDDNAMQIEAISSL